MPMVTSRRGTASPPSGRRGGTHSLGRAVDPSTPKESLLQEGLPQWEAVSGVWAFQTLVKGGLPGAPDPSQEPGIAAQLLGPFNVIGPEGTNSWQQVERVVHLGGTECREGWDLRGLWAPCSQPSECQKNPSNSHMIQISTLQLIIEKTQKDQKRPGNQPPSCFIVVSLGIQYAPKARKSRAQPA